MANHTELAIQRLARNFSRTFHAYFARPDMLTPDHDEQLYWLARHLGHEGRQLLGESR